MALFTHRTAGGRCPCGAEHAACGPPSDVVPVDERIEEVAAVSGPLKKYRVTSPSGVQTVMKLNEADAKARGLTDDDLLQAPEAEPETANAPAEEAEQEPDTSKEKKAPPAQNKARAGSANKSRGD